MTGAELALVVLVVVALGAVVALTVTVVQLRGQVAALRTLTEDFLAHAVPTIDELAETTRTAGRQVDRLDDLISTAGSVGEVVDGATQATVRVLSNPVIKTAAIARGTARVARRARQRETG